MAAVGVDALRLGESRCTERAAQQSLRRRDKSRQVCVPIRSPSENLVDLVLLSLSTSLWIYAIPVCTRIRCTRPSNPTRPDEQTSKRLSSSLNERAPRFARLCSSHSSSAQVDRTRSHDFTKGLHAGLSFLCIPLLQPSIPWGLDSRRPTAAPRTSPSRRPEFLHFHPPEKQKDAFKSSRRVHDVQHLCTKLEERDLPQFPLSAPSSSSLSPEKWVEDREPILSAEKNVSSNPRFWP